MSVERTRALLGGKREGVGNVVAAGLGVVTPFCSCSAVPAFIGFVAAGVPLGVTLSFLIASPLVNEIAIGLLLACSAGKIAAIYVGRRRWSSRSSPGGVLGRMHLERWVEPFVFETTLRGKPIDPSRGLSWDDRLTMGREEVGHHPAQDLAVPAGRHRARRGHPRLGAGRLLRHLRRRRQPARRRWSPSSIGVPLYSNAAGIMPLVEALHGKGLPMGTVLAFMMSVVALSLPEMILLRRVLKPQLLADVRRGGGHRHPRHRLPVQRDPRRN